MDVVTLFIPHPQTSLIEEPIEGRFHNIAILPQPTAMFGVALGDQRCDSTLPQRLANPFFGIVGAIGKHFIRTLARPTPPLLDAGNPIHQSHGHFGIMNVGPRVLNGQRRPLPVHDQMALRAICVPIRRIRSSFRPPPKGAHRTTVYGRS